MATQIDVTDRRTARALEILTGSDQWLKLRTPNGYKAYGVPSQSQAGVYHITNTMLCDCVDRKRHPTLDCKHMQAVKLLVALLRASH